MPLPIELHLYTTIECNAACRMCNVASSPERTEEMDLDDAKRYIGDVLRLGEIENFVLTGGEALLYPDRVIELAQHAQSRGLKTRISTNAFWGSPEEEAAALLARLKEAGVVHLWISTDAFHAEFVPLETVKKALHAASQEGMAFYVQSTYLFPEADVFGAQGTYDGPLHNDYDRRTRAIQDELSGMFRPKKYGWGRVIFKERGVSLKTYLGDDLPRAEQLLAGALDSLPNRDGKVDDRLVICLSPNGTIDVNGRDIGRVPAEGVDAAVREWGSQRGVEL